MCVVDANPSFLTSTFWVAATAGALPRAFCASWLLWHDTVLLAGLCALSNESEWRGASMS
jgi:hypothetical protein